MKTYTKELKNCWDCPLHIFRRCLPTNKIFDKNYKKSFPSWCPLPDTSPMELNTKGKWELK